MASTAGGRKRQRSPSIATAACIPEELVREILLRLPSKSVLRFRAVCKAWLRLLSDPGFALEHHRSQPDLPLVAFLRDASKELDAVDYCVEALELRTNDFRSVIRFTDSNERCSYFSIHASCDGLLLLSSKDDLCVCNPATHQWTRLPTPVRFSWFVGFYRHGPTGEYRALFYRGDGPSRNYYVLVAGSREGKSMGRLPSVDDGYEFDSNPKGKSALLNGNLHWPSHECHDHKILVLDTVTEVFHWMRPPPVIREHMPLLEMEDKLAVFSCDEDVTMVELWILQDYENQLWVCKYRVELPALEISTFPLDQDWLHFFMSREGVVLVTPQQRLLHYDMDGNLQEIFRCDGRLLKITRYVLKESLVRHAFFQIQDNVGDGEEELPLFFQGL
uniref:F-box domain-containing protein n=1 Tax=Arundo donax TaxID=35708 RepID=A0A0A9HUM2_ARUDO